MGIPLVAGNLLPRNMPPDASRVLVISRTMAERWFGGEDPIGRRMKLTAYEQDGPWFTVIGVVGDTRHTALDLVVRPQVYVHHRADPYQQMAVVLRTRAGQSGYAPLVRRAVSALDRNQPVGRIRTMDEILAQSVSRQRFTMFLVAIFAVLALVLALVGLYAVVSHSVAERTREMGVRLAVGASRGSVLRLVVGEALRLVVIGIALGLITTLMFSGTLSTLLFEVSTRDMSTLILVGTVLLVVGVLASYLPARRAMRVDPVVALRAE
jgi:putative ABC transport system permease protein